MKKENDEKEAAVAAEVLAAVEAAPDVENLSHEECEARITADLMKSEGIEENTELREMFGNSYFFPICYDGAIVGVNPLTQSITYDYMKLGYLRVLFVEYTYPDYADTMYGCEKMVEWINELTEEELEGKVKPTLCLREFDNEYWNDIQQGGWSWTYVSVVGLEKRD